MHVERLLRLIAGVFVVLTVVLSQVHSPYWLFFALFVGLNLTQSFFTDWCPMMTFLKWFGVRKCSGAARSHG